ncbi:MAG: methyltransferase domain-containing protein [Aphanocapsa lilacina HA4352-LM1]|jgi:ubiquinone/menaquinone biosynthesis C-methylase UbiE|nr:methyltransferase domain-containing protein [Aphanocapsa lilacina HA4352-LM1]
MPCFLSQANYLFLILRKRLRSTEEAALIAAIAAVYRPNGSGRRIKQPSFKARIAGKVRSLLGHRQLYIMLTYEFIDPLEQLASDDFRFIEEFVQSTGRTQLGWHYITDLTWIYSQVKHWPNGLRVLDAGGGGGPVQFLLAELGFTVANVDMVLGEPPVAYRERYRTERRILPSYIPTPYAAMVADGVARRGSDWLKHWLRWSPVYQAYKSRKYSRAHDGWRRQNQLDARLGELQWCVGNLCHMPEFATASFDAVVSLSALEHIPAEALDQALQEIRRVLKPNAHWAVTTSGTEREATWFHEPSQGYCFAALDLEKHFLAYRRKDQDPAWILERYRQCDYLRENLAEFYKSSNKFGMPLGRWDPKYIPVALS